jgi:hypothetical protein
MRTAPTHDSFAEWLKSAEDSVKKIKRRGPAVEPFIINIADSLDWCLVKGRQLGTEARSKYVVEKLRLKHQATGRDTRFRAQSRLQPQRTRKSAGRCSPVSVFAEWPPSTMPRMMAEV